MLPGTPRVGWVQAAVAILLRQSSRVTHLLTPMIASYALVVRYARAH